MAVLPVIAAVSAVAAIGSGVVGAMGAMQQGDATARAENYNAQIADYNKSVAERNRAAVLGQSHNDAIDKARDNKRMLSSIKASYGASGLELSGSPLDVMEDSATEAELDVRKTIYKGDLQAAGYTDEAKNYEMKAQLHRMAATDAKRAGKISAVGAFLGGVEKAGSTLMRAA